MTNVVSVFFVIATRRISHYNTHLQFSISFGKWVGLGEDDIVKKNSSEHSTL